MKLFTIRVFTAILFVFGFLSNFANAQSGQCNSGGCSGGTLYPSAEKSTTTDNWTIVSTVIYAGEYAIYNVVSGQTYEWSLLSADGGSCSYDSQLTLSSEDGSVKYCYSDDVQNLNAKIQWTATFTGKVRVLVNQYNCQTNSTSTTLVWRCGSCGVINAPANDECASLKLTNGTYGGQTLAAWIDYNNDGIYSSTEKLDEFSNIDGSLSVTIPLQFPLEQRLERQKCWYVLFGQLQISILAKRIAMAKQKFTVLKLFLHA